MERSVEKRMSERVIANILAKCKIEELVIDILNTREKMKFEIEKGCGKSNFLEIYGRRNEYEDHKEKQLTTLLLLLFCYNSNKIIIEINKIQIIV